MDWMMILEGVLALLVLAALCVMTYFKYEGDMKAVICELIALAEKAEIPGKEKMDAVVACIYEGHVPVFLKKIFTEERIRTIAQDIFDWMRIYADNYLESKKMKEAEETENGSEEAEESTGNGTEETTDEKAEET